MTVWRNLNASFSDIIYLTSHYHPTSELIISIRKLEAESKKYNKLKFGIVPKEVFDPGDRIIPNEKNNSIHITEIETSIELPPIKKNKTT